ncbi:MAG: IS5 family transposase [Desulfovibrio sp.]|nr:IS5 family transposase [Desulfovibrio sp.]
MYLLQVWFSLSDEGAGDEICGNAAMAWFAGVNIASDRVPDATTLLHFRHLLEDNGLAEAMFRRLNELLEQKGLMMRGGSIVDATIIAAPSSMENRKKERDPEMHQTRKGNQRHFGMKSHIGVDAGSGLVHTVVNTAASVSDVTKTGGLTRDDDGAVYGDSGCTGAEKRPEIAGDAKKSVATFRINKRKSMVTAKWDKAIEARKSGVRSKVEHPFLIVKRYFGFCKAVCKGLRKNGSRLFSLFASANILMCARAGRLGRSQA